jgi:hypothetical protein
VSLQATQRSLACTLALLGAVAAWFYVRQNAGLQIGGEISGPKMLWLAYALAAWFVMPLFLWADQRLDWRVRRLFGALWLVMVGRGVAELLLIYGVGHWRPSYGITHDLFCLAVIWQMRRGVRPTNVASRRALQFSGSVAVALVAEIAFAGMFLQTGAADERIYFASSAERWRFINLVTSLVLAFVLPDLVATLVGLYFPGVPREAPRSLQLSRLAAAAGAMIVAMGALGLWTWRPEVVAAWHW